MYTQSAFQHVASVYQSVLHIILETSNLDKILIQCRHHWCGRYSFNQTTFEVQPRPLIHLELNLVIVLGNAPH